MFSFFSAQLNKLGNFFFEQDPIAMMQLEHDRAVKKVQGARDGLEQYRGLVEGVQTDVNKLERQVDKLKRETQMYLKTGDKVTASKFATQYKTTQARLAEKVRQLAEHEAAYENHLKKFKHANSELGKTRERIKQYEAELKMSEAEADVARISQGFDFDVTTDFSQFEDIVQSKINKNKGAVRVANDLSEQGIAEIEAQERMEAQMGMDALKEFEIEMGMVTPDTVDASEIEKELGTEES